MQYSFGGKTYTAHDAEDVIRADSARNVELVAGFDPEVLACMEEDSKRWGKRDSSNGPRRKHSGERIA
jgi:hypothetical protein